MIIKQFQVGYLATNCYLVYGEASKQGILIDPGDDEKAILRFLKENNISISAVAATHGHPDHIGAVYEVLQEINVSLLIGEEDVKIGKIMGLTLPKGIKVEFFTDLQELRINSLDIKFLATPGHSPGGFSIVIKDNIFTGDTLFAGSIGRTDLPGGSITAMRNSLKRIMAFPENYKVYPGHGPDSTVGIEIKENPFLRNL
jgi:glyoxylase-like metal-dependent hydrolase (beta-lactamase superfamily II)